MLYPDGCMLDPPVRLIPSQMLLPAYLLMGVWWLSNKDRMVWEVKDQEGSLLALYI